MKLIISKTETIHYKEKRLFYSFLVIILLMATLTISKNGNAQCDANFTYYDTLECNKFKFVDQSLPANISTWTWTFQGGSPASHNGKIPPIITFATSGNKIVKLTVSVAGAGACSDEKQDTIVVPEIPVVDFSYNQDCNKFTFTPTVSGISDSLRWSFGDGTFAIVYNTNPQVHIYNPVMVNTSKTVSLKVFSSNGCTNLKSNPITLRPKPSFKITMNRNCNTFIFNIDVNPYNISVWDWKLNGVTFSNSPPSVMHTFNNAPGVYDISLFVKNLWGCENTIDTTITIFEPSFASFGFENNHCSEVPVQFTNQSTGVDLTYSWDFGDGTPNSNQLNPLHEFVTAGNTTEDFNVKLTVTDTAGCVEDTTIKVTVLQKPDVVLTSSPPNFSNCDFFNPQNPNFNVTIFCNNKNYLNYIIDWGDTQTWQGTPFPSGGILHTFTEGLYTIQLTVEGANGCFTHQTYHITNIANPAGGIVNPGGTVDCGPIGFCFPVLGIWDNHESTNYSIDFGDGSEIELYGQLDIPDTLCHLYTSSSCGYTLNKFTAIFKAMNACDTTITTVTPIRVYTPPGPSFIMSPKPVACVGTEISFDNTTPLGTGVSCDSTIHFQWDFGDGTPIINTTSREDQYHTYTQTGFYLITLHGENDCGPEAFSDTICIEAPVTVPDFGFSNVGGSCAPDTLQMINYTDTTEICSDYDYYWWVYFENSICGNQDGLWGFAPGYNYYSEEPKIYFKDPGLYSIFLRVYNSCQPQGIDSYHSVEVKSYPYISIDSIPNICALGSVQPTAVISDCYAAFDSLRWTFPGGIPSTSTINPPGNVVYSATGQYNVILQAWGACGAFSDTVTFNVSSYPDPEFEADTACFGSPTIFVDKTISGFTIDEWTWDFGEGNPLVYDFFHNQISHLYTLPGVYNVTLTVKNTHGCESTFSDQILVDEINIVNVSFSDISCHDSLDGAIHVVSSGGVPPVIFTLNPPNAPPNQTGIFTGLPAATYTVTVSDDFCSIDTVPLPIIEPDPILIEDIDFTHISCCFLNDGQICVQASGGTGSLTYTLEKNGSTTQPQSPLNCFNNLGPGFYRIWADDENGCPADTSGVIQIIDPPCISVKWSEKKDISCYGYNNGEIKIIGMGGTGSLTYVLNPPNGNFEMLGDTARFYNLAQGNYQVKITDVNNCQLTTAPFNILNPPFFGIIQQTCQNITCNNVNNGYIKITVGGGVQPYTFTLYEQPLNPGPTIGPQMQNIAEFPNLDEGNYFVVITDNNGCADTSDVCIITNPDLLQIQKVNAYDVLCHGGENGKIVVFPVGGTQPYSVVLTPLYPGIKVGDSVIFQGLPPDVYDVALNDANNCPPANWVNITIGEPDPISLTYLEVKDISCSSYADGSICAAADGGVGAYSWNLSGIGAPTSVNGDTACWTIPHQGVYNLLMDDENGCHFAYNNIAVNEPEGFSLLPAPLVIQPSCHDSLNGEIHVFTEGGTLPFLHKLYKFGSPSILAATSNLEDAFFTGLGSGQYRDSIFDSNVCPLTTGLLSIINPSPILIDSIVQTNISCWGLNSGILHIYASGGTGMLTYILQQPGQSNNTGIFTSLAPGNYTIIVQDALNCPKAIVDTIIITQPASITITSQSKKDVTCNNWTDGEIHVTAAGGTPQLKFTLVQTNEIQFVEGHFLNLAHGSYTVKITDAHNCPEITLSFTINNPAPVLAQINSTNVQCFGFNNGVISIIGSGGIPPFEYSINGGTNFYSTSLFNNLEPGNYQVVIRDHNLCLSNIWQISITEPPLLSLQTNSVTYPSGFGSSDGQISMISSGGTSPYHHFWYETTNPETFLLNSTGSLSIFDNIPSGNYCDSVVDGNLCSVVNCFLLSQPEQLIIDSLVYQNILCHGEMNGKIAVFVSGGVPPYFFNWSNGQTGYGINVQNGLSPGNYTILVTDDNGYQVFTSQVIIEPEPISIGFETNIICYAQDSGWVVAEPFGGTPPYNYLWGNSETTPFLTGLLPDNWYLLTVTDNNNCSKTDSVYLPQNPPLLVSILNTDSTVCLGGSINLLGSRVGGAGPFEIIWEPQIFLSDHTLLNPVASPTTETMFYLKITDINGCIQTDSILISIDSLPVAGFTNQNAPCVSSTIILQNTSSFYGSNLGMAFWEFGDGTSQTAIGSNLFEPVYHTFSQEGFYEVCLTVFNDGNCSDKYCMQVWGDNPLFEIDFEADTVCIEETTHFTDLILTPEANIERWEWDFGDGQTSTVYHPNQDPVHLYAWPGIFNVMVVAYDENGCSAAVFHQVVIAPLPFVDFTYNSECYNNQVNFINTSDTTVLKIDSWLWDFGDDTFSTEFAPIHIYAGIGIFQVALTAASNRGCQNLKTSEIVVNPLPVAAFYTPATCYGSTTCFQDSSYAQMGLIKHWYWNFGEPVSGLYNTSILQNPCHNYLNPGVYNVQLVIIATNGCSDTIVSQVEVIPAPHADFMTDIVCFNDSVHFTDLSIPALSNIVAWNWQFGDGELSSIKNPSHYYVFPGEKFVKLTVTDEEGCSNSIEKNVLVQQNPIAQFGYENNCSGFVTYFFDFSNGLGSDISAWQWTFGDLSSPNNISFQQNPSHVYTNAGVYEVVLYAENAAGCFDFDTLLVEVAPTPVADFSFESQCQGELVQFVNLSQPNGNQIDFYWSFGDGTHSDIPSPSHIYNGFGSFFVSLLIENEFGCKAAIMKEIEIFPDPIANFDVIGSNCAGSIAQFIDFSFALGSQEVVSWHWDFGDDEFSQLQNPEHQYQVSGFYNVTLTIFTDQGCQDIYEDLIQVGHLPVSSFAFETLDCDTTYFENLSFVISNNDSITSWVWNFGDPASGWFNQSMQRNPYHIYYEPGIYPASLLVTTQNGCQADTTVLVIVDRPVANFLADTSCNNNITHFTDLSVSNYEITSWLWQFGDGESSISPQPVHIYNQPGVYPVNLTITSQNNCVSSKYKPVYVLAAPTADFWFNNSNCSNQEIQFYDYSFLTGPGQINQWNWQFGDGDVSILKNPIHSYNNEGSYIVTLQVADTSHDASCASIAIQKVIEISPNPIAAFIFEIDLCNLVNFYADSSIANADTIVNFEWNFDDPQSGYSNYSNHKNPSHLFYDNGYYNVILIITNSNGCFDTISHQVIIEKPEAKFSFDAECSGHTTYFFDESFSPGNSIESWYWEFGDGLTSLEQNPTHIFMQGGWKYVSLTVWNTDNCFQNFIDTVFIDYSPNVSFEYSQNACLQDSIYFTDLSNSTYGNHLITNWEWDFGDGEFSNLQNPVHLYQNSGSFTVTLVASDENGCYSSHIKQVQISEKPIAGFIYDIENCLTGNFTDASVSIGNENMSWLWNFGDPTSGGSNYSTLQNPTHNFYTASDTFFVTLIVENTNGCKDTIVQNVNVSRPFADFEYSPDTVCSREPIVFSDLSFSANNVIEDWMWDFGDGQSASSQNPSHVFEYGGTYYVSLTVFNSTGCMDNIVKEIYVRNTPVTFFDFSWPVCLNESIQFNDLTQSTGGSNQIVSWLWDFGDGIFSTLQNPSHKYQSQGNKIVTLSAQDSNGCDNTFSREIHISSKPFASFNFSIQDCEKVVFTDNSIGQFPDTIIAGWYWNFDDSISGVQNHSSLQNPEHFYFQGGYYDVLLIATNNFGCSDTIVQQVFVDKPKAAFSYEQNCVNKVTHFSDESTSFSSPISEYHWDFDDGATSSLKNPDHIFTEARTYFVTLWIMNEDSCWSYLAKPVNLFYPPIAFFSVTGNCENEIAQFTDLSQQPQSNITDWLWNFGDGNSSNLQNTSHIFTNPGNYEVSLEVKNENNCSDVFIDWISIQPGPVAQFEFEVECNLAFFNENSITFGSEINYWAWSFGDGSDTLYNVQNPSHEYAEPGNYIVSLEVSDFFGCKDMFLQNIFCNPIPEASFTGLDPVYCQYDETDTLVGSQTPFGYFSGPGITNLGNGKAEFNPQAPGYGGPYPINYFVQIGNCENSSTQDVTIHPAPEAYFSQNPSNFACGNDSVFFYDLSNPLNGSQIVSWLWNFGDGNYSSIQNPAHLFNVSFGGNQEIVNITLTIGAIVQGSPDTCFSSYQKSLILSKPPYADFEFDVENNCEGNFIQFNDLSLPNASSLTGWRWDFGDGFFMNNLANPQHAYINAGEYEVTLIVFNSNNCSDTITHPIMINELPTVDFTCQSVCHHQNTLLKIDETITNISEIVSGHWQIGQDIIEFGANPSPIQYLFENPGIHTVSLSILNINGCENSISHQVIVYERPVPNFDFSPEIYSCNNQAIQFSDISVVTNGAEIVSWEWDFNDNSSGNGNSSYIQNPTHLFSSSVIVNQDTTYFVNLKIADSHGCDSSIVRPVLVKSAPEANFTVTIPCTGMQVEFYQNSLPHASVIENYFWDFGDGNFSNVEFPVHIYGQAGNYAVTLSIEDSFGCIDDTTKNVEIFPVPEIYFLSDTVCQVDTTKIWLNSDLMNLNSLQSWSLNFDDGFSAINIEPTDIVKHVLLKDTTIVNFTVIDLLGCVNEKEAYLLLNLNPLVYDVKGGGVICPGDSAEISLDWSNEGINYTLFQNMTELITLPGINHELSFGFFDVEAIYTVNAYNPLTMCNLMMQSNAEIQVIQQFFVGLGENDTIPANQTIVLEAELKDSFGNILPSNNFTFRWWNDKGYVIPPVQTIELYSPNITSTCIELGVEATETSTGCIATDTILICFAVDIFEISFSQPKIVIFPNPTTGDLHVEITDFYEDMKVSIITSQGLLVQQEVCVMTGKGSCSKTYDMAKFTKGVYLVKFESAKTTIIKKVVVN